MLRCLDMQLFSIFGELNKKLKDCVEPKYEYFYNLYFVNSLVLIA